MISDIVIGTWLKGTDGGGVVAAILSNKISSHNSFTVVGFARRTRHKVRQVSHTAIVVIGNRPP